MWILLLLLSSNPSPNYPIEQTVDIVELNHVYCSNQNTFSQLIFWQWDGERMQVVAWRYWEKKSLIPYYNYRLCKYELTWRDKNVYRRVLSYSFKETHESYDIEAEEREILPISNRTGLIKERK